ncbi:MAG: SsrA-binding protein SmpB [Neisseriaceae bacterium]|nr:SsrA-binding protein SmpB [Neisseriaceae bacterium]
MSIAKNKKAFHEYFIEEQLEAGLVLDGWEVKAMRAGRVQIAESYVVWQRNAFWLIGAHVTPLLSASTHVKPVTVRERKLLLNQREIDTYVGKIQRAGYTIVPLDLHYSKGRVKVQIGLAKGKKQHDKRNSDKDKDWAREKEQMMKKAKY